MFQLSDLSCDRARRRIVGCGSTIRPTNLMASAETSRKFDLFAARNEAEDKGFVWCPPKHTRVCRLAKGTGWGWLISPPSSTAHWQIGSVFSGNEGFMWGLGHVRWRERLAILAPRGGVQRI